MSLDSTTSGFVKKGKNVRKETEIYRIALSSCNILIIRARVCNASMDNRDVVAVMPTGKLSRLLKTILMCFSFRRREIPNVSTYCPAMLGHYFGDLAIDFTYHGSNIAFA